ncbi:hypothetical protein P5673_021569 [Acropora cervicornis]|uniref:Uncharacterized protein n=1 Tax=Acropora cervicornis TaxID=6130 RepID=A0AAD9Q8M0_ACRCE|nr:hypothetical protein P5673_021569 [Acropora cervicornis]
MLVYSPGKLESCVRWTKSAYDVFAVMNDAIASCHWLRCERCLCDVTMKGFLQFLFNDLTDVSHTIRFKFNQ